MPTHVLHKCPSFVTLIVNIRSETSSGVIPTPAKKPTATRGARSRASHRYRAKPPKNAKAPSANSEIGTPPHIDSRNIAEYELYMAARHASASDVGAAPGMKL